MQVRLEWPVYLVYPPILQHVLLYLVLAILVEENRNPLGFRVKNPLFALVYLVRF